MSITKQELIEIVLSILTEEQMKELEAKLIAIDSKENETPEEPKPVAKKKVVNEDFSVNREGADRSRSSVPVRAGSNTWVDEGEERDGVDDKIVKTIMPRTRVKPKTQVMVCSLCHQPKEVPAGLLRKGGYYRCENCVGGR